MAIRVSRNEEGNCVTFVGASNPAYWNSCLSAVINDDDPTRFNIVNDIRSSNSDDIQYEFYAVEFADFADKDGNVFTSAQEAVDYINANANVLGVSDIGIDLNGIDVNFRLDATSTSIVMDNGSAFGVNTIQAVADADGTIHLHAVSPTKPNEGDEANAKKHFEGLEVGRVSVDGTVVAGGLQDITNTLNELFTVGAFESVVIADPFSTMVADVDGDDAGYTLEGNDAVDPIGDDIFSYDGSGYANYAGLKSTATIDQAGEYYTFDIRGEGVIGFGLVHTDTSYADGKFQGNSNYANPTNFAAINSAHYGMQFSHWFHPTPNGSWTNYGALTGYVGGSGWSNWDQKQDWLDGNPVKIKCGLDVNGYISIESLQDDGTWVLHARSNYPVPQGSSFHLGIKSQSTAARVATAPKVHLLEPAAPTMYFRYIESPDGVFNYPLFTTAEEANYYDEIHNGLSAGTGSSHTHTYADDPTNTTWYMPEASHDPTSYQYSVVPDGTETFNGNAVTYTEVTSVTNADLTPSVFSASAITQQEGTAVNVAVTPAGATWTTSVAISPSGSGLVYNSGSGLIQGTLADVGSDTVYTVTVVRANSYGSSTGTMTITATDVAPVQTYDTPWTKALDFSGNNEHAKQVASYYTVNPLHMNGYATNIAPPTTAGYTANGSSVRPWATAVVFNSKNVTSNQHIWNQGEGAGDNDDNIYLRVSGTNGNLYFGWGRQGAVNECLIGNIGGVANSTHWWGVYIANNGTRLSSANATAANLAAAFDIRLMGSNDTTPWGAVYDVGTEADWTAGSTGARMDRTYTGDFTIGGRGSNRNFHGKVASMVVTTLRINQPMPTDAEIEVMITDPKKWLDDYKVGEPFRPNYTAGDFGNFAIGTETCYRATQVWLMGDGTYDSYANGIRNQAGAEDQNNTKMQLNSMVSNDIQTVNITGLT